MAGLSNHALALVLDGSTTYAGFFTAAPDDDGTGGTEATGSGYVRKAAPSWVNATVSDVRYRQNSAAIEFAALSADLEDIVAWGIWDAVSSGNLLAWGMLLDVGGSEIAKTFTSGNQPRFITGELKVGLRDE